MADAFVTEPMSMMSGTGHEYWTMAYDILLNQMGNYALDNGLSVVAVDQASGKVCGAFIGHDSQFDFMSLGFSKNWYLMKKVMEMEKLGPRASELDWMMHQLNIELKIELKDIVKKYKLKNDKGVICEMLAVGVHKDF